MPSLLGLDVAPEHAEVLQQLRTARPPVYTLETLLSRKSRVLVRELPGVSVSQLEDCKRAVAQRCLGRVYSAYNFVKLERALKHFCSGSKALDECLGGGFRSGEVTEIVGPSGAGKSQLGFTAAMSAALCGEEVVYVDSSNSFCAKRVVEIGLDQLSLNATLLEESARAAHSDPQSSGRELDAEHLVSRALTRIRVVHVYDGFSLLDALHEMVALGGSHDSENVERRVADLLVVVDSITAVIAPILGQNMAGMMHAIAAKLREMTSQSRRRCAALVMNNTVAGSYNTSGHEKANVDPVQTLRTLKPALGLSWMYQASKRLSLVPIARKDSADQRGVAFLTKSVPAGDRREPVNFSLSRAGFTDALSVAR